MLFCVEKLRLIVVLGESSIGNIVVLNNNDVIIINNINNKK